MALNSRALVFARTGVNTGNEIQLKARPEQRATTWTEFAPPNDGLKTNGAVLENALIERPLRHAQGNKTRAAKILGVHRRLLYEKIREYGLPE